MKYLNVAIFSISIVIIGGCASVITGTDQTMTFNSEPDEATVTVAGKVVGKTPVSVKIDKGKQQTLTFEKEGYKTHTEQLSTTVNGWFWGNIICCGLLGSTTDGASGAMHEFSPDQYFVTLTSNSAFNVTTSKSRKIKYMVLTFGDDIRAELAMGGGEITQVILQLAGISAGDKEYNVNVEVLRKLASKSEDDLEFAKRIIEFYDVS